MSPRSPAHLARHQRAAICDQKAKRNEKNAEPECRTREACRNFAHTNRNKFIPPPPKCAARLTILFYFIKFPRGPTGQPPTFWNTVSRSICHCGHWQWSDGKTECPPSIPFNLLKKVHISLVEEMAMIKCRGDYWIPNLNKMRSSSRQNP